MMRSVAGDRSWCAVSFDNPWIRAVSREGGPRAWLTAAAAGVVAAAAVVAGQTAGRYAPSFTPVASYSTLLTEALVNLVLFGVLWATAILAASYERRSVWRSGARPASALLLGAGLGVGLYIIAVALVAASGRVVHGGGLQGIAAVPGVVAGLALTAFQAGGEEVFFRGWLQPVLCARWGPWLGLLATALLFALLHLVAGERSTLALVNLMLGGATFGLLALRTGGLFAPFAMHLGWNWTESSLLGLYPNPGVGPTGALIDLDFVGPGVWTGGADAMNGSLAATLPLALLLVALIFRRRPAAGQPC